jgi:short-subunit dehydrogenase
MASLRRRPRKPDTNLWNRALITGASSGIGESFARLLAAQGTHLVVVARRHERLLRLAEDSARHDVDVEILGADLADRQDLASVVARLQSDDQPVDLLINNAGFGVVGDVIDHDPDVESSMIEVNISALHRLAHAGGGAMVRRGRGSILNVSSIAGFTPSPKSATYGATKAFVTSFSEALAIELGPQGVMVSCLCPGLTRTEFQQRAGYQPDLLPEAFWQSADDVARAGLKGLAAGQTVIVPGAHNKAARGAARLIPAGAVRRVARRLAEANGK